MVRQKAILRDYKITFDATYSEPAIGKSRLEVRQVNEKHERIDLIQESTDTMYFEISVFKDQGESCQEMQAFEAAVKATIKSGLEVLVNFIERINGKSAIFMIAKAKQGNIVTIAHWTPFSKAGYFGGPMIGILSGLPLFATIDILRSIKIQKLV